MDTQGLQCSSFLVMTYFLLRDYDILPKTELHWSPWIVSCASSRDSCRHQAARTPEDRAECWRAHFGGQEAGDIVDPACYAQVFASQFGQSRDVPFAISAVPHLHEIAGAILGMRKRKAGGPDSITSELLQLSVATSARQLLPIFAKASLGMRERTPLLFGEDGHHEFLLRFFPKHFPCFGPRTISKQDPTQGSALTGCRPLRECQALLEFLSLM